MKIFYMMTLSIISTSVSAQTLTSDRQKAVKTESAQYAKMLNYNVNPNTLNYDLTYQRLELDLDPAVRHVAGTVTSHFTALQNMSSIYFDLSNSLTVSEVKFRNQNLSFTQLSTKELKIELATSLAVGTTDSITIRYAGVPSAVGSAGDAFTTSTQAGTPVLYTLSEPYGAQEWFPTKQSMNDKIDKVDIVITTPVQYSVASNGKLLSETTLPANKKRTFWQTNYPIPAYLVALGITNYTKFNDTMGTPPFSFVNYVYPATANSSSAMANINWTKDAMELFEQHFGPYPYRAEKYGHMQFGWGGGMEHATMSSMGSFGKGLIAHELAHQWFGDKVTCGAWNDIWLNEGFASFGEHLVNEKLLMTETQFQNYLNAEMSSITSSPGGSVYVSDANLANINAVFSSRLSYSKGAYVVRMMRWILGDEAFYAALKDYLDRPELAYGYAVTADLKNSILQSTGKDLTEFFNDWIYGQGYPIYQIRWNQTPDKVLRFKIGQTQSHASVSFFELPLPVKITGTLGEVLSVKLDHTSNGQNFEIPVSFDVASVQFNADRQIVTRNSTVVKDSSILSAHDISVAPLSVYPNPVQNILFVAGLKNAAPFEIFHLDGKRVLSGKLQPHASVDVSKLAAGVYLIKIEETTHKFIKK